MLLSMTGYGKADKQIGDNNYTVEIRSLNSKNIDIKVRIPLEYREKELEIRKLVGNRTTRGKIDFNLTFKNINNISNNQVNTRALNSYVKQISDVYPDLDINILIPSILRMPDILVQDERDINEKEWKEIVKLIEIALNKLGEFRVSEGESLEEDLMSNIKIIHDLLKKVSEIDKRRIESKKEKIRLELDMLNIDIDKNRFEQELIYYVEKFDINEEKIRLQNHLDYFLKELKDKNTIKGKKLGFISQEIGREINTLGSKANDSDMQRYVVQMKDALERIKEQVLNVL